MKICHRMTWLGWGLLECRISATDPTISRTERDSHSWTDAPVTKPALLSGSTVPSAVITDHHQPYVKAIQRTLPMAAHIRSGLHRVTGETNEGVRAQPYTDTRPSAFLTWLEDAAHRPTPSRRFECLRALRGGHIQLQTLARAFGLQLATGSGADRRCRRTRAGHALEPKAA